MDHEPRCRERLDSDACRADADPTASGDLTGGGHSPSPRPGRERSGRDVDWLTAQAELDECDGYVVLAVDPQTGEVDAHGPFPGFGALEAAESMRETLDREELFDVVVRVVRWHQELSGWDAA